VAGLLLFKQATGQATADWLRAEWRAYEALDEDFVPQPVAWDGAADPILILEDLSTGFWPPPWSASHIERIVSLLDRLAAIDAPQHFRSLAGDQALFRGWQKLAEDPSGFLGLGLVSREWLRDALPALIREEAAAVLAGDALVHGDIRSDNVCFHESRTLLVDWPPAGTPASI
jgi:hypothetical protein